MKTLSRFLLATLWLFLATTGHLVADSFQDLLKRVPEQANVLLLLDVEAIQNSALGRRENFARKHENDCLNGVTAIPPTVSKLVVASQLDPTTLHLGWKITLAEVKSRKQRFPRGSLTKYFTGALGRERDELEAALARGCVQGPE